jgi:hypothetical protein
VASYKLNIGLMRGCPPAEELAEKLGQVAPGERFAVEDLASSSRAVRCRLLRFTDLTVDCWDEKNARVEPMAVRKATSFPLLFRPEAEMVEVQAGSIRSLEQVELLLTECVGLAVTVEKIAFDVIDLLSRLRPLTSKFQLVGGAVELFSANSYTLGPYRPKFEDTENGLEFLEKYAEAVKSARVRFAGKNAKVTVTLAPASSFGFSCCEDDQDATLALLRQVVTGSG